MQSAISKTLIEWYKKNKRDLPWRNTTDAYTIWISEIILQQTRVAQGLNYFERFIRRFPDVQSLAAAREEEVLRYWQGLGYYSRARNLHAAAKEVLEQFNGTFPNRYEDVRSLKGIGDYTAAAICSFAYRQPYAVLDGNVYRVLSRLLSIETAIDTPTGKRHFQEAAYSLLDEKEPDIYNQAIMEFGALQCTPQQPQCLSCPLAGNCLAHGKGIEKSLPRKQGKTSVKERFFNYFYIQNKGSIWIHKRTGNDIWKNLFELPLIETDKRLSLEELQQTKAYRELFAGIQRIGMSSSVFEAKHILSHRIIYASFYTIEIDTPGSGLSGYRQIAASEIDDFAVSRLTLRFLEHIHA